MKPMDPKELEALLASTPDIPENEVLIEQLSSLLAESRIVKWPYTVSAQFYTAGANNNIAVGATVTANVAIDASAPFVIVSQTYYANTANAAINVGNHPIPNVVILLTDTGSNRQLMDVPVPVWTIFGSGQFPFILPEPKVMQANSILQVQATNRDAAVAFNLYLEFHGYRIYKLS